MRGLKLLYLFVGAAVFAVIVLKTDFTRAWDLALEIGWGFWVVLALFMVEFIAMNQIWHLTFKSIPLNRQWAYRLWKVRMVGEAFNVATPFAMMGGEAVKAVILKKRHGIGYVEGAASLVLARTTIVIALVIFLAVGFALMLGSPVVSHAYRVSSGTGLGIFSLAILLFFLVQRFKFLSRSGQFLRRGRIGRFAATIHATEDRLIEFYSRQRGRFALAVLLALAHWIIGVAALYYTFLFLGHPVSLAEAWMMEAFAQMVRAATFFIPANIGTQDGAFVVIVAAVTGDPTLGLAVALVRRGREIVWVVWGLALGWRFLGKTGAMVGELAAEPGAQGQ